MFFTLSSEENLGPKLDWLATQTSSEIIRRVLFRQPSLLGHNAQGNLAPKVRHRLSVRSEYIVYLIGGEGYPLWSRKVAVIFMI